MYHCIAAVVSSDRLRAVWPGWSEQHENPSPAAVQLGKLNVSHIATNTQHIRFVQSSSQSAGSLAPGYTIQYSILNY